MGPAAIGRSAFECRCALFLLRLGHPPLPRSCLVTETLEGGGWGIRPRVGCPVLSCLRPAGARRAAGRPSSTPGSAARAHAAGTTAAICQRLASDARVRAGGHWTRRLSHKTRPRGTCMRH